MCRHSYRGPDRWRRNERRPNPQSVQLRRRLHRSGSPVAWPINVTPELGRDRSNGINVRRQLKEYHQLTAHRRSMSTWNGEDSMEIVQTRRRFLTRLSLAGAASLLHLPRALAAEGALETTTVRLVND